MTRKMTLLYVALMAVPTVVQAQTPAAGGALFDFAYRPGTVTQLRMVNKTIGAITLPAPLPEQKFSQTVSQVLTIKCLKVNPDKSADFETTLSDMSVEMNIGGMSIKSGGAKNASAPAGNNPVTKMMERMFTAMEGAKFTMTISNTGEVKKLTGLSEFMDKLFKSMTDESTPAEVRQSMKEMAKGFTDSGFKDQMNSCYRMLPGKKGPFKAGDKWDHTWSQNMPFGNSTMVGKGQYEFLGVEQFKGHECAKIRLKETFDMAPAADAPAKSTGGIFDKMNMKISGTGGDGLAYVDQKTGQIVQLRQTQNLTIAIEFKAPVGGTSTQPGVTPPAMTQKLRNSIQIDEVQPGDVVVQPAEAPAAK